MRSLRNYFSVSSIVFAVAIFIAASVFGETSGDAPSNEIIQADTSNYSKLLEKVRAEGRIRIIVGLKTSFVPEGRHASANTVTEQRLRISQMQESLLKSVAIPEENSIKKFKYTPFIAVKVDEATLQSLINNPMVNSIEEDRLNRPMLYETIPLIGANSGEANTYTGSGQTIAILDTGVDKTHPFLSGKVVAEACYSSNDSSQGVSSLCPNGQATQTGSGAGINCPSSVDGCSHGTHVAGIAAGKRTQNSVCSIGDYCMRGVAPDANIIAIQVFSRFDNASECSNNGHSSPCALVYDSDYKSALEYVYSLRNAYTIASVNMSIGGQGYTINCDNAYSAIKADIDQLRSVGIATIIASGNNYYINGIDAPACISSAISVGATEYGIWAAEEVTSYSNSASFLSLLAPGGHVPDSSSFYSGIFGIYSSIPGGGWAKHAGTSMAAPHVAGAWALMKQKNPSASVDTILSKLQTTGKSFTDSKNNITKKRIQVDAALSALSAPSCTYSISPTSQSFTSSAGTGSVTVTPSSSSCSWTATESLDWVSITSGSSGTGSGTVSYSVSANTSTSSRSGNMTIAGQTFTITQSASSCTYTISPTSQSFTSSGGTGSVTVTPSASSCAWTATENLDWVTITFGASGTGNGTVTISVSANTTGASRTGNITIAGQTFTITQSAACTYTTTPTSQLFTSAAGTGSITVTASSGSCGWTAAESLDWATINSGSSGTGSGTVSYSVSANTSTSSRSGNMTIAGQTFTITQSAACTYTTTPTSQSFTSAAGTGSVTVTASASSCAWTAASSSKLGNYNLRQQRHRQRYSNYLCFSQYRHKFTDRHNNNRRTDLHNHTVRDTIK